ncbi:cold-responsive protein kinase 1-like [Senna tora]|uniref:Cold-responsive protein kinase 1-like n=1 Tax=Senna tora TaxID=362788 RepID=A0A834TYN2_9FABA|nr:cold-responsive protein kinase 1-like [Senna tora]
MVLLGHHLNNPLLFFIILCSCFWNRSLYGAVSVEPSQGLLLDRGCSQYNNSNLGSFFENLNASLGEMRTQVRNQSTHFATAMKNKENNPVYALFLCRDYLPVADCLDCFAAAEVQIRNCSYGGASGARVTYDGCFLRYESNEFKEQNTDAGNRMKCGNHSAREATAFDSAMDQVLMNLQIAIPRIANFSAATETKVPNNNNNNNGTSSIIYAFAQCILTITPQGCLDCLKIGHQNLETCLPNSEGRAFDTGCFIRYSNISFFPHNYTMDITPYLKQGGSSKMAIIGGVSGGAALVLILLALFGWLRKSKRPKRVPRGDILGATELKGPVNYGYKDLKSATNNFSEENKIGEGGFGDVYKVINLIKIHFQV